MTDEEQKTRTEKRIKTLDMIIEDMPRDVKELDGKPFTGSNVAGMFGKQAAAIQAMAMILKEQLDQGSKN